MTKQDSRTNVIFLLLVGRHRRLISQLTRTTIVVRHGAVLEDVTNDTHRPNIGFANVFAAAIFRTLTRSL